MDVYSIDLPGHGESYKELIETDSIELHTDIISQILNDEEFDELRIMAIILSSSNSSSFRICEIISVCNSMESVSINSLYDSPCPGRSIE